MNPAVFVIEDGEVSFQVPGDIGWTAIVAGYAQFPSPRRERDAWPVLIPKTPETIDSLRILMSREADG